MEKDLFGKKVVQKKRRTKLEVALRKTDNESFEDRLHRLKYLNKIFPHDLFLGADQETIYILSEAKMTFINGEYIATILLTIAFIERLMQSHYESIGLGKIAKRGLKAMIAHANKNELLHPYLLEKFDLLRKKRNPLTHLKPFEHEHNLSQRIINGIKNDEQYVNPILMLEEDAKEAITLMYALLKTKFNEIKNAT